MAGQLVPGGGCVANRPALLDAGGETSSRQVAGNPASGQPLMEVPGGYLVEAGDFGQWRRRLRRAEEVVRRAGGDGSGVPRAGLREPGVKVGQDRVGGGENAAGHRADGCGRVSTRIGAGPGGNVGEPDGLRADAQADRGQVGDGVCFNLAEPVAGNGAAGVKAGGLAVQEHMPDLVGKRGHGLHGCGVRIDVDAAVRPGGERFGIAAVLVEHCETGAAGDMDQRGPRARPRAVCRSQVAQSWPVRNGPGWPAGQSGMWSLVMAGPAGLAAGLRYETLRRPGLPTGLCGWWWRRRRGWAWGSRVPMAGRPGRRLVIQSMTWAGRFVTVSNTVRSSSGPSGSRPRERACACSVCAICRPRCSRPSGAAGEPGPPAWLTGAVQGAWMPVPARSAWRGVEGASCVCGCRVNSGAAWYIASAGPSPSARSRS